MVWHYRQFTLFNIKHGGKKLKIEQRANIEFCFKIEENATKTLCNLIKVYDDECVYCEHMFLNDSRNFGMARESANVGECVQVV